MLLAIANFVAGIPIVGPGVVGRIFSLGAVQDPLLFKPHPDYIDALKSPSEYGLSATETFIDVGNDKLSIWTHEVNNDQPLVTLIFGNTGHMDVGAVPKGWPEEYDRHYRVNLLKKLENAGIGYRVVFPRGYGNSTGTPSQKAFEEDMAAVNNTFGNQPMIGLGESLGCFSLSELGKIAQNNMELVIMIAPFSDMIRRAQEDVPNMPFEKMETVIRHPMDVQKNVVGFSPETELVLIAPQNDQTTSPKNSERILKVAKEAELNVKKIDDPNGHLTWEHHPIVKVIQEHLSERSTEKNSTSPEEGNTPEKKWTKATQKPQPPRGQAI